MIALLVCHAANANTDIFEPLGPSQSDFGGAGLLQMPTARMAKEGEFSANYFDNEQYRRWSVSVQPFEWFEATLRYTDIRTRLYSSSPGFSGDQTYKDKGIDFKFRLMQESTWLPTVSLGFRDLMGTGLFDSEYVVASKRYGPFDFTLGMGWGNMGESGNITNPFCRWKDDWCGRDGSYSSEGGKFETGSMFHGNSALFGGVEYQTPWQPLRLKLEYDGNDYSNEFAGKVTQSSPINVGVVYRVFDYMDTHLSYQRGNTLMWGVTLRTNFNDLRQNHLDEPHPVYMESRVPAEDTAVNWTAMADQFDRNAGWQESTITQHQNSVSLSGQQYKYRDPQETLDRTAVIAANQLPASVTELKVIERQRNLALQETVIDLDSVREANMPPILGDEKSVKSHKQAPESQMGDVRYQSDAERFSYSFDPSLTQSFGGPESFYMYQVGVNANSELRLSEKNWLQGTLFFNVANNFDEFNYKTPPADADKLPRVRTWIREYVDSSNILLNNLQLTHLDQFSQDWYGQVYGGYLEMMYAGAGGELLYRPFGKSWALGVDGNWVKQRDWNNTLKMADYDVVTGHVTGYWQLPFLEGVTAKVAVGRYLAGDVGATFDFSKRFDSGIVMGAYATLTDVSADEYGEGSFTKGIYVTIPFDLMLIRPTTSKGTIGWVPLTRDGGQMLNRSQSLYDLTERLPL
ncbi:YjbH domain-containing protein [Aeromonas hydrophila]|uniref:YjbH domain-containing protein n=1 Tax=Aeromonas hydrophila TaxID=644 RepID=UPI001E46FBF5|nr:YjbH domain-containing protein [Aeromonas hydrophila]MCO4222017.1 YjbH domain-containing protein [Aeromonas hydrophila]UUT51912.1 YjbH domain-containing protein [Aeromonas hydrophila]WEF00667.1 YjbH domain-containing protein [Aeromonas hydrophila]